LHRIELGNRTSDVEHRAVRSAETVHGEGDDPQRDVRLFGRAEQLLQLTSHDGVVGHFDP
jgi:hypothetical protein